MLNCCVSCFKDSFLRNKIFAERILGDCHYCNSRSQSIINVTKLTSEFESFFTIYDFSQKGAHWDTYIPSNAISGEDFAEDIVFCDLKPLHVHIQNDWSIFSGILTEENRIRLLSDILLYSDDEYIKKYYKPKILFAHFYDNIIIDNNTSLWQQFCDELKTRNRYILKSTPINEVVELLKTK